VNSVALVTQSYFDGELHHASGPFTIAVHDGRIVEIVDGDCGDALAAQALRTTGCAPLTIAAQFVMPGLVEAHCHLFLNGAELDAAKRKDYLGAPFDEMLAVGRRSVAQNLAAGITLIRDAGDLHGVNTRLKAELAAQTGMHPELRSPGRALRKTGRYGSFMAIEAGDEAAIVRALRELAPTADDLKILLTGIIDFEKGCMKGGLQFSLEETRLITRTARELGKRTYAHCSGIEGLRVAVDAGIDSIEHGFFMQRDILEAMAEKQIAWVPTFSPVQFQHDRPELAGWNATTAEGLRRILDNHYEHIALAALLGVPIVAGSDAGSYGVPHGQGLIDELHSMLRAGLPLEKALAAASTVPRRLWSCELADIVPGHRANLVALARSPFEDMAALREVSGVLLGAEWENRAAARACDGLTSVNPAVAHPA